MRPRDTVAQNSLGLLHVHLSILFSSPALTRLISCYARRCPFCTMEKLGLPMPMSMSIPMPMPSAPSSQPPLGILHPSSIQSQSEQGKLEFVRLSPVLSQTPDEAASASPKPTDGGKPDPFMKCSFPISSPVRGPQSHQSPPPLSRTGPQYSLSW